MAATLAVETQELKTADVTTASEAGGWARWTVDGGRALEDTRQDGSVTLLSTVRELSGCRLLLASGRWLAATKQVRAGSGSVPGSVQSPAWEHWSIGALEHWNLLTLWRRRSGREVGPDSAGVGSLARWFLALAISPCSLR